MRQLSLAAGIVCLLAWGCVDGSADGNPSGADPGTDYTSNISGSGNAQAGSGVSAMAGSATSASGAGSGGTSSVGSAGTNSSAGTAGSATAMGGGASAGSGNGTGGTNGPAEGGTGSTETNPGKGNGFFPQTLLPSHAKFAYTTWKGKYLKMCSATRYRVASNGEETVSEGIGYGMLLTVAHGDRTEFDGLWGYYKDHSSGGVMGWKASGCGNNVVDGNSASDADLDAAMALIQASCKWGGTYLAEAQTLIAAIKSNETIEGGENFLKPAHQGLDSCQNVSYASPGYYRAFAKKKPDQAAFWNKLASDSYTQLSRTANGSTGLVPNWSNMSGGAGCGGKPDGDRYGYDAARTPWRVATDYVWNGTPAAKDWLTKLVTWVDGPAGGITTIGDKYQLNGTKESPNHNSTFTGALALAGMSQSQSKADQYATAFKAVSDGAYFEESLRAVYMLLASGLFLNACD
ncbi:MAG TPA: glycosyl hydrolase family 8 [Polyangiaceae bacterium]|nr:glycosyl hydrolase family 8 [Polyangiaceae bacterium]